MYLSTWTNWQKRKRFRVCVCVRAHTLILYWQNKCSMKTGWNSSSNGFICMLHWFYHSESKRFIILTPPRGAEANFKRYSRNMPSTYPRWQKHLRLSYYYNWWISYYQQHGGCWYISLSTSFKIHFKVTWFHPIGGQRLI